MSLVRCGYHHLVEVYLGLALDFDNLQFEKARHSEDVAGSSRGCIHVYMVLW